METGAATGILWAALVLSQLVGNSPTSPSLIKCLGWRNCNSYSMEFSSKINHHWPRRKRSRGRNHKTKEIGS